MKSRKRNYNALQMQMKRYETELEINKNEKPTPEQERIERKLKKHRIKYTSNKLVRAEPWGENPLKLSKSQHVLNIFSYSSDTKDATSAHNQRLGL